MDWLSPPGLALLIATNTAPVLAAWLLAGRGEWPLDGGRVLRDGERLLGSHKTWRGLAASVLAGSICAPWLGIPVTSGALAGALTIAGDALSSFAKRRLRVPPGTWIPGLDQVPESALPLLVVWAPLQLDLLRYAATVVVFSLLDLVASRIFGSSRRRPEPDPPHR